MRALLWLTDASIPPLAEATVKVKEVTLQHLLCVHSASLHGFWDIEEQLNIATAMWYKIFC